MGSDALLLIGEQVLEPDPANGPAGRLFSRRADDGHVRKCALADGELRTVSHRASSPARRSLPGLAGTIAYRPLATAPLRIARQIVEHLEPWELFFGMRVQ